jgi:predicted outer membrane repeat protein
VALDGSGADGQTWATAYKTIQTAIDDSQMVGGGEIHVKKGVYSVTAAITVTKAVRIYGGYSGVDDTRDWTANQTSVDAGSTAPHCFYVTANATIDGFGILNGSGIGNNSNGGGVNIISCAPTINDCVFLSNHTAGFGGALATLAGTGTRITSCTFTQNTASQCGGAIYNEQGTAMQITDCVFTANAAGDSGGAIHNVSCTLTITGCSFQTNEASQTTLGAGGAILNEESSPTITNCVFTGNRAPYGVGIYNYLGSPTIDGCLFASCDPAALSGGGVYNNGGTPTIKSSLFQLNSVKDQGGGLFDQGAAGKTINCVFWKNSAAYGGGGIYIAKASDGATTANPQFTNCTVSGNSTSWRGGGVCSDPTPGTFLNCIIWGNSAGDSNAGIYATAGWSAGEPAAQYSDIEGDSAYPGIGNLNADPKLMDPTNSNFGLAFDSPCIDAGSNAAILGYVKDYEENTRVVDGNGDGKALVDMGAVELQGQPDHLADGEITQSVVYDSPTATTPTYTFLLRLDTDDGVTSVQFQAPGGNTTYTIPTDAHTSSGSVETYHLVQGKAHTWEYWVQASSPSALTAYGDGVYHITVNYRNNTQAQMQVAYYVPNTTTPIPQPTQKPQMTSPAYDGSAVSPVVFQWGACTDAAANAVRLTITDANSTEAVDSVLAATATQSGECTLNEGAYEAELAFANLYDNVASSDGTPFRFGRAVVVGHRFTVPYTAVHHFLASSVNANFYTISAKEKDRITANWPDYWTYKGVAFNAWATKSNDQLFPVYRFWSGRSHFYTISEDEKSRILVLWPNVWHLEGIAFYAYPEGTEPSDAKAVYRFWDNNTGTHYYTIDEAEATTLSTDQSYQYTYEGVAFYAYPP